MMIRPKNEEKRKAICAAATQLFAERGFDAMPTAEISRQAGVAEGTLFLYFKTKGELANVIYQDLQAELAAALLADFPRQKKIRRRLRHFWDARVRWGMAHPSQHRAMSQLELSRALTLEVRNAKTTAMVEFEAVIAEAIGQQCIRKNLSPDFIAGAFKVLAAITIHEIMLHPNHSEQILRSGFKVFWAGMTDLRGQRK